MKLNQLQRASKSSNSLNERSASRGEIRANTHVRFQGAKCFVVVAVGAEH